MPIITTVNMFYLGNFSDADSNENDTATDNAGAFLGDYGKPQTISVTEHDQDGDRVIKDNESNYGGDTVSYDNGSGTQTVQLDSTNWFTANVTLGDGTVQEVNVAVLQMTNGDTFIRDVNNELDGLNIQKLELTNVRNDNYSGSYTGNSIENTRMVCFLQGTMIETEFGLRLIQRLKTGDKVLTADQGFQPILWIGSGFLQQPGKHAPIVIGAHALGKNMPDRALKVSPQHRIFLSSSIAKRMLDQGEALIPAHRLTALPGIEQTQSDAPVRYWHILTEVHQLVSANGAWAETLFPGPEALKSLSPDARDEIKAILPLLWDGLNYAKARPEPSPRKQKTLIARHLRNAKPLVDCARLS